MAEMDDKQARTWGMLCHIAAFAGFIIPLVGNIVGPLVIWLIKKEEHPFIDDQGKESLNFQITISIGGLVASILTCLAGLGIILGIAIFVFYVVFVIIAAIKASNGEQYRYPVTLRLVK